MDGENNGKPYEQMDDLGVPLFLETPIYTQWLPILYYQLLVSLYLLFLVMFDKINFTIGFLTRASKTLIVSCGWIAGDLKYIEYPPNSVSPSSSPTADGTKLSFSETDMVPLKLARSKSSLVILAQHNCVMSRHVTSCISLYSPFLRETIALDALVFYWTIWMKKTPSIFLKLPPHKRRLFCISIIHKIGHDS